MRFILFILILLLLSPVHKFVIPDISAEIIDLNQFFADPTVTVSVDGTSASIFEDSLLSPVLLSNDPSVGDTQLIFPVTGSLLSFDFDFMEGQGNVDEFNAFIVDDIGFSAGSGFEFFAQDTSSGSVAFDLSSLAGEAIGVQFELFSSDVGAFDSSVIVSNLDHSIIPEPGTWSLFAVVGAAIIFCNRSRFKSSRFKSSRFSG